MTREWWYKEESGGRRNGGRVHRPAIPEDLYKEISPSSCPPPSLHCLFAPFSLRSFDYESLPIKSPNVRAGIQA
jgi:hypothetical protein